MKTRSKPYACFSFRSLPVAENVVGACTTISFVPSSESRSGYSTFAGSVSSPSRGLVLTKTRMLPLSSKIVALSFLRSISSLRRVSIVASFAARASASFSLIVVNSRLCASWLPSRKCAFETRAAFSCSSAELCCSTEASCFRRLFIVAFPASSCVWRDVMLSFSACTWSADSAARPSSDFRNSSISDCNFLISLACLVLTSSSSSQCWEVRSAISSRFCFSISSLAAFTSFSSPSTARSPSLSSFCNCFSCLEAMLLASFSCRLSSS